MISVNEKTGICEIEGRGIDLICDLSIITHMLITETDLTPADIIGAVVVGLESKEEETE